MKLTSGQFQKGYMRNSALAICAFMILSFAKASHGPMNSNHSISEQNRIGRDFQTEGDYQVQWTMSLGGKELVVESDYLKAGLEQAVKDYINMDLKCKDQAVSTPAKSKLAQTSFRSIAIATIRTTSQKRRIISGNGVCNGNPEACQVGLTNSISNKNSNQDDNRKTTDGMSEECLTFQNTTIFNFFEDVFETGLYFDYQADIATEKNELESTMELDYNVSFVPAKLDGLDKIQEIEMDVRSIKDITPLCSEPQCETQKSTILDLFDHFGISADKTEHECSYIGVNCDKNNLVKFLFIDNKNTEKTIPESIANLTSIRGIFLGGQDLKGTIPTQLGSLNNLKMLWLQDNELTGTIPSEFGQLKKMRQLVLRGNRLRGVIPREMTSLSKLEILNLGHNFLQGRIPKFTIGDTTNDDDDTDDDWSTNMPSAIPSHPPTKSPTNIPTKSPTNIPTKSPTNIPSKSPTNIPTKSPTNIPTKSPTNIPTRWPSNSPSFSALPSNDPTRTFEPTSTTEPSNVPTFTSAPSLVPTNFPSSSIMPSQAPSKEHSEVPSQAPSEEHSEVPSQAPSEEHSEVPSQAPSEEHSEVPTQMFNEVQTDAPTKNSNVPLGGCRRKFKPISRIGKILSMLIDRFTQTSRGTPRLKSLSLYANVFTGEIPHEIFDLPDLKHLNLARNWLSSTISTNLGKLRSLTVLDLHDNKLRGSIPEEIQNLDQMELLNFFGNDMTGKIPENIGSLKKLTNLVLDNNRFTGPIPTSIGQLSQLQFLSFSENKMKGDFPTQVGNLVLLNHLDFRDYDVIGDSASKTLSGTLPTELGLLRSWKYIILQNNNLRGDIPAEFGNLEATEALWLKGDSVFLGSDGASQGITAEELYNISELKYVNLDNMNISGTIPPIFGDLIALEYLSMKNNSLSGTIPSQLGLLQALETLLLDSNDLLGPLPSELGTLTKLKTFDMRDNNLIGHIPSEIGNMDSLQNFDIGGNMFTGIIPTEIGKLNKLKILTIENNNIYGAIPSELGLLNILQVLKLGNNAINGSLPSEIGHLSLLATCDIEYNSLSGKIPPEVANLEELEIFTAASNELNGTIPPAMGALTKLRELKLGDNYLAGAIPTEVGLLNNLRELDLSNNHLNGSLPSEILHLQQNLFHLDIGSNKLTGLISSQVGDLWKLQYLDLGKNNLNGDIPHYLNQLTDLRHLNIGGNNLNGFIPGTFGSQLRDLEYLNIGKNNLIGSIPTLFGTNLFRLKTLMFGGNQDLSGDIPAGIKSVLESNRSSLELFDISGTKIVPDWFLCDLKQFHPDHSPKLDCSNYCGTEDEQCTLSDLRGAACSDIGCKRNKRPTCTDKCILDYSLCEPGQEDVFFQLNIRTQNKGWGTEWTVMDESSMMLSEKSKSYRNHELFSEFRCFPKECYTFHISINGESSSNPSAEVIGYLLVVDEDIIGKTNPSRPGSKTHAIGTCTRAPHPSAATFPSSFPSTHPTISTQTSFPSEVPSITASPSSSILPSFIPTSKISTSPSIFRDIQVPSEKPSFFPSMSAYPSANPSAYFQTLIYANSTDIRLPHDESPGSAIAISDTHIVAQGSNEEMVYIYDIFETTWVNISALDAEIGDGFGESIAVNDDLMVIGAPSKSSRRGAAYVFHSSGDFFAKLTAPDSIMGDTFGFSVAISDSHIAVGAYRNSGGKVYIFTTILNPVGDPVILQPDDLGADDWFGYSVDMSANHIVVGAPAQSNVRGAVYIFTNLGVQVSKIVSFDEDTGNELGFGKSVAICDDVVVVGFPDYGNLIGAAYIIDTTGTLLKKLENSLGSVGDLFGDDVAISNSYIAVRKKDTVVIYNFMGDFLAYRTALGEAHISLTDDKLAFSDRESIRILLHSTATMSPSAVSSQKPSIDPTSIPTSSPSFTPLNCPSHKFEMRLYLNTDKFGHETSWEMIKKTSNEVVASGDEYGSLQSYIIRKCLPYDCYSFIIKDAGGDGVCCFQGDGSYEIFNEEDLLLKGGEFEEEDSRSFCMNVSPSAAPSRFPTNTPSSTPTKSMSPTLFSFSIVKIIAPDGASGDGFGYSVSASNDVIVIGSDKDDDKGSDSGSAYIFNTNGDYITKLVAPDGASGDWFGYSVSASNDVIVIGAYGDDHDNISDSGSAYIFNTNGDYIKKLVAPDGASNDYFGYSVSVSDGVVVIGAYGDSHDKGTGSGSAYIFNTNGDYITKLVAPDGASGDWFGRSVSVSDGVVVIGADGDDDKGTNSGSAYIFNTNGDYITKLVNPANAFDWFGGSVSVSDGVVVIGAVGGDDKGTNSGSAYIFNTNGDFIKKLVAPDGVDNDLFGGSVSVSDNAIVIGADRDDDTNGSAYIFNTNGDFITKLFAPDGASLDYFGRSVSVSDSAIVIGSYMSAYIATTKFLLPTPAPSNSVAPTATIKPSLNPTRSFLPSTIPTNKPSLIPTKSFVPSKIPTNKPSLTAFSKAIKRIIPPDGASGDWFGFSVSVSDGVVVIGAYKDDDKGGDSGSAYIFNTNGDYITNLVAPDGDSKDNFGRSVSVSDGVVVIGAYKDENDDDNGFWSGSAYIFNTNGDFIKKLVAPDGASGDWFGFSVSVSDGVVVIGAYKDGGSGSAYIFNTNGDYITNLVAPDGFAADWFGYSVSVSDGVIVIGAYGDDHDNIPDSGSAYIFNTNGDYITKLVAPDGAFGDAFGYSVSVSDGVVVIGAYTDDDNGFDSGSAYIFNTNGDYIKKLVAPDGVDNDNFGRSVSVSDGVVVVGAHFDDDKGTDSGSAYIFNTNGDFIKKLVAPDSASGDRFGRSVSVSDGVVVIGAYGGDDKGSDSGSAYIVTIKSLLPTPTPTSSSPSDST